ncbi:unnamed protein product [Leptidea sinapis]|uniref:Uncharacterized protein n=1 Tax=Leptidea sinapis TaxID=189913 RepID=A0A5E4PKC7_9NEOP|nr:unnamed protein product [Leptidea sinapis]
MRGSIVLATSSLLAYIINHCAFCVYYLYYVICATLKQEGTSTPAGVTSPTPTYQPMHCLEAATRSSCPIGSRPAVLYCIYRKSEQTHIIG